MAHIIRPAILSLAYSSLTLQVPHHPKELHPPNPQILNSKPETVKSLHEL